VFSRSELRDLRQRAIEIQKQSLKLIATSRLLCVNSGLALDSSRGALIEKDVIRRYEEAKKLLRRRARTTSS